MENLFSYTSGTVNFQHLVIRAESEPFYSSKCNDKYELIYFVDATGRCTVEGSEYEITPGSVLMINPMEFCHLYFSFGKDSVIYSLQFTKAALHDEVLDLFNKMNDNEDTSGFFYSDNKVTSGFKSSFDDMFLVTNLSPQLKKPYAEASLAKILLFLYDMDGEGIQHLDFSLAARVCRHINKNIEKNISLDKLARRFFVSKYHLCRAFKEYCGISVHSYITHKRIVYAKQFIDGGMTASEAAEKLGFSDYSTFYRAFVKIMGKSPTSE